MPVGGLARSQVSREFEMANGFYSAPTTIGAAATALYTTTTTPARTSGQSVTVYTILVENSTGAAGTAWVNGTQNLVVQIVGLEA